MVTKSLILVCVTLWISTAYSRNPLQEAYDNIKCERVGYTHIVKVHNCQPQSVKINICQGTCLSASTPTGRNFDQVKMCTCCTQTQTETIKVGLWCLHDPNDAKLHQYYHPIESATECSCSVC